MFTFENDGALLQRMTDRRTLDKGNTRIDIYMSFLASSTNSKQSFYKDKKMEKKSTNSQTAHSKAMRAATAKAATAKRRASGDIKNVSMQLTPANADKLRELKGTGTWGELVEKLLSSKG